MLHSREFSLGNIYTEELSSICETIKKCLFRHLECSELDACRNCEVKLFCAGGCRARAYSCSGDIRGADPYCVFMSEYYALCLKELDCKFKDGR